MANYISPSAIAPNPGWNLESIGAAVIRYGLVAVLLWVGALKFAAYEMENIKPLVTNSPLTAWAVGAFGLATLSKLIGTVEITLAILIALRRFSPMAALARSGCFSSH